VSVDEVFDVVVVGSANLDLVARTARLPGPGETVHGSSFVELPGGKGLNQAIAAARAGARVAFVGAVGDDAAGALLRGVAIADGVDDRWLITVPGVASGRALISVDDTAENSIVVVPGANARVGFDGFPHARVVLAQLEVDPAVVAAAFGLARSRGALTILNPAPADGVPDGLVALCDVVVPNEHELAVLGGPAELAAAGVATLVVTRGAAGADLHERVGGGWSTQPVAPFDVDAVDTTGAGDAFCGAMAARLAAGASLVDALVFAAANGALATTRPGAVPSLPYAADTWSLVERTVR
jgi:ribokinase